MPKQIFTRLTTPPTVNDRLTALQEICLDKHWCRLLAARWKVSVMTVRRWVAAGLLGGVYRHNLQRVELASMAVLMFEQRYADVLSVGEPVFNAGQVARRYGVDRRTIRNWRSKHRFPEPDRVPRSQMLRWKLSQLEQWERLYRITPVTTRIP